MVFTRKPPTLYYRQRVSVHVHIRKPLADDYVRTGCVHTLPVFQIDATSAVDTVHGAMVNSQARLAAEPAN